MKTFFFSVFFLLILFLNGCQTIENKSQKAMKEENKKLSQFLQQPETELKIVMGEPDNIVYDEKGSEFFVYVNKKYGITCKRSFEINKKRMVIGFSSKGCF